jgi:hypothetical protein
MALVKCKECGKEFSKAASSCPECGRPRKRLWAVLKHPLLLILITNILIAGTFRYLDTRRQEDTVQQQLATQALSEFAMESFYLSVQYSTTVEEKIRFSELCDKTPTITLETALDDRIFKSLDAERLKYIEKFAEAKLLFGIMLPLAISYGPHLINLLENLQKNAKKTASDIEGIIFDCDHALTLEQRKEARLEVQNREERLRADYLAVANYIVARGLAGKKIPREIPYP